MNAKCVKWLYMCPALLGSQGVPLAVCDPVECVVSHFS